VVEDSISKDDVRSRAFHETMLSVVELGRRMLSVDLLEDNRHYYCGTDTSVLPLGTDAKAGVSSAATT
jgi:hypothetical protein